MIQLKRIPDQASVYFVSLGCPKNLVDSQVMLGLLEKNRYKLSDSPEKAEVIIVNTCSFIEQSKEESINTLLELAEHKETGACQVLVASGCLSQRYSKELEAELPEVDLFVGTGQYHKITEILDRYSNEGRRRSYVDQPAFIHTEKDPRMHTGPKHSAFLKLSEGCNRRCAFCIIPKLRGNVRSRTIDSLVAEAKQLAGAGVRELNLVAQDLTHYGMEWKFRENLERLLPELCKVDGIEWIRLHYVYPDEFSDELIDVIAREPKIVKYLDMPIQHTSDRVLQSMNRKLTKTKLFDLVGKLRTKIPEITFRTSMIVGFPGESEQDFAELVQDLEALNLEHVGVFEFSPEEGTPAFDMEPKVSKPTKRKRLKIITAMLEQQRASRLKSHIGREFTVMIEGPSAESDALIQARLSTQAVEIDGHVLINDIEGTDQEQLRPGLFARVVITEAHAHDYVAKLKKVLA